MKRLLVVLLLCAPPVLADTMPEAMRAYDGGDYREARRIWAVLAEQGDEHAMVSLAGLYQQGLGGPRDLARARALYREAARLGHVSAMHNVAEMLERGEGGPVNLPHAFCFYERAYIAGSIWARTQAQRLLDQGVKADCG